MKYFVIILFFIGFLPVFAEETESIVLTPFDIIFSEDDFTTQGPNHNILILERGQSATINITLENNDRESHQITLKNPRPSTSMLFDSFKFEPERITVLAHQKNSTKLHITISEDTNTHSSFVTFLAQSNTFGMKGIGFVLVVDGEIDELVDKSLRSGFPGPAFPRIDIQISEDEAEKMIDNGYGTPGYLPKNYQFRGMTDWGDSKQFVYSPSLVENSTEFTNFWKDGGMLISYYNYIDRPNVNNTKSLPVRIAQDEGQQVMINDMMGMAIEKHTRVVAYSDMEYDVPAEVDFFDDTKRASVSLEANMPLDDLLKVASSILVFEEDSTSEENSAGGDLDRTIYSEDSISNHEIIPWDDFEYEFVEDAAIFKNNLAGLGILEAGTEYYIVQKAEFKASSFGDKDTRVNATIGYAIQTGDQMLHPPMHENATDKEHREFSMKIEKQSKEFPQQSPIGDSYDFVVDVDNPFYIKFPFVIEEPGQYTRQFYKNTHISQGPGSSGMGGLAVVEKFSKAVDENGECKNDDFRRLVKHDYSTMVCVYSETAWKLIGRGWGL